MKRQKLKKNKHIGLFELEKNIITLASDLTPTHPFFKTATTLKS